MKNSVRISTILLLPVIVCVALALQGSFRERWDSLKEKAKKALWSPRDKIIDWHDRREEKKKGLRVLSPTEVIAKKQAGIGLTAKFKTVTTPEIKKIKEEIAVLKQIEKKLWEEHRLVEQEKGPYAASKISSAAMRIPFKIKDLEREIARLKAQEIAR